MMFNSGCELGDVIGGNIQLKKLLDTHQEMPNFTFLINVMVVRYPLLFIHKVTHQLSIYSHKQVRMSGDFLTFLSVLNREKL